MLYLTWRKVCLCTLATISSSLYAVTLDASFGTGGKVTTDFAGSADLMRSLAIQLDGKIVAAGTSIIGAGTDFTLARYNSNGTLDASFGKGGKVTTDFGSTFEGALSVAVQPDGKIVAAGQAVIGSFNRFALARYNSDGTLDPAFGTGGKVITGFAGVSAQANSVAVQWDGKIVAAGQANSNGGIDFALVRYNSDGTLDTSFGAGGKVTTLFVHLPNQTFSFAEAFSVALQPDGKIVAAGRAFVVPGSDFSLGGWDFALARYNTNGTLDAGFGTGGKVTTDVGGLNDGAQSVALQPDGKIVTAGQGGPGSQGFAFALARYNGNGTLDSGFGTSGKLTTDFGGFTDSASSVAVQPDGKIVAAGRAFINGGFDFALARYNSNGTLNLRFGAGGKLTTDFASPGDEAFAVAIQWDGKIVAGGRGGAGDFVLARYQ